MEKKTWLVTGAAGFIGSHLVEKLLLLDQKVIGMDNFSNGSLKNLVDVRKIVGDKCDNFTFIEGDITDPSDCFAAVYGANYVLHQAAFGSVPRSLVNPDIYAVNNIQGTANMLEAARQNGVEKFVYASSSSVYGDTLALPFHENRIGKPLSPYAASKLVNEIMAQNYTQCFNLKTVGLRYFNVFGPRANPRGLYANVIPRWIRAMKVGKDVIVHGDGKISRDFCYVENVVRANILAATKECNHPIYNVACSQSTNLNELFEMLKEEMRDLYPRSALSNKVHRERREGDMNHTFASIDLISQDLQYEPSVLIADGIKQTLHSQQ